MKKLIITESQLKSLKTFLFEAKKNDEEIQSFIKEIKKEFISTINANSVGDYVTFTFGNVEKDGNWVNDSLSILTFKILETGAGDGTGVKLEFVTSEGKETTINNSQKGNIFMLYPRGTEGIHFRKQKANVGFLPVDGEGKKSKPILIPEFISFIVTSKDEKTNAILAAEKAQQKWLEANDKFNKSMQYKPGFLGMDNFFFFPKGYLAMDKTLAKFGLSVHNNQNRITFKIKNNISVKGEKTLASNSNLKGYSSLENGQEVYTIPSPSGTGGKFIFDITDKHIETGSTDIDAFVTYKDADGNVVSNFSGLENGNKIKINVIYK